MTAPTQPQIAAAACDTCLVHAWSNWISAGIFLGLFLPGRGRAQVSVNLVDAERTDLPHLVARIRFEAEKRGHRIRRGERIGLLTEPAVAGASAEDLALEELRPEHLIETHVRRRLGLS